jgi:pimeloyl-ACP methyl ester carboxylesterase
MTGDVMLSNTPLTLGDHDPRVMAAEAAEKEFYDFYGISCTTRHIMLPRHGIRVRITETGEGDPVVIVPGNTGDGFPFIPLLPHLPGRQVITVNRPGGGLSEGMDHTTVDFHDFAVETLTTVFDALGFESAPIIAHSMGGHWSQWFAIARPERVTALALLGVPGNVLTTRPALLLRLTTIPGLGKLVGRLTVPKEPRTALNGLKITGHSAESIARQPAALAECYYRFPQLPHYLTSTLSLMTSVNRLRGSAPRYRITAEQLVTITQPVLYLWGTHDPFGCVETGRKIASLVPDSEFRTLAGGGHLPWLDDPEYAGRLVSGFLDRHQPLEAMNHD